MTFRGRLIAAIQGGDTMKREQLHELVYQMLEAERGGIQVYTTALACVVNEDLRKE